MNMNMRRLVENARQGFQTRLQGDEGSQGGDRFGRASSGKRSRFCQMSSKQICWQHLSTFCGRYIGE